MWDGEIVGAVDVCLNDMKDAGVVEALLDCPYRTNLQQAGHNELAGAKM